MRRALLNLGLLTILWGSLASVAYAGFGIAPPYVRNETLRPGSEYTQEIIIVRSDPVEDLDAELTLNIPGIESWFSFDRGIKFTLPKGEPQVKMHVTVRVPDDAKLGSYNGNIRIRTSSPTAPTTGVSIALGAQVDVRLKIVEEIFDFEVRRVELFEAEEGYKKWWLDYPGKIKFALYIENTGNVPAAPYAVTMRIYDVSGQQLLETTAHTNKLASILPFATKKIYAYLPTWLPPGGYRVKYTIQKTAEEIAQEGELAFSILPRGTITGYEGYGFEGLSLGDKLSIILPAILFVFIVLGIALLGRRRARAGGRPSGPPREMREVREPERKYVRPPAAARGGVVDLSRRPRK